MTMYGKRIKELRLERGWTQMQLAEKMGMPVQCSNSICRWEQDYFPPTKESLRNLAEALGVSPYKAFPEAFACADDGVTLNEYQKAAQRTSNTNRRVSKIKNGLLGLAGEVGELCDHYKKYQYQDHGFDREHMMKELGDVLWYVAELACGLECTLEGIAQMNIDKLKARYPDGFAAEKSLHRAEDDD